MRETHAHSQLIDIVLSPIGEYSADWLAHRYLNFVSTSSMSEWLSSYSACLLSERSMVRGEHRVIV